METETLILLQDVIRLFDIKLINPDDLIELIVRFSFNLFIVFCIVNYLYYPIARRKDYYFTYIISSVIVFVISFSMINVGDLTIGVALGLFAIFGILRFRTVQLPIKEMTYLFLVIGISLINAMVFSEKSISYAELVFINGVYFLITWGGEKFFLSKKQNVKRIVYEKIELIKPENQELLLKDLKERTGLNIKRIEIERINFLRDTARIRIYYSDDVNDKFLDEKGEKTIIY